MFVLDSLRTFTEHNDVDDLIELSALAKLVVKEYEDRKAPVPEHVAEQLATLDTVIKAKLSAAKAKRIRDLKLKIDGTKDRAERRKDFEQELADLLASQ